MVDRSRCNDRCYGEPCVHLSNDAQHPEFSEDDNDLAFPNWGKSFEMNVTFGEVDTDVLGLLTGGEMGTRPAPTFSVEIGGTVPWKWWQWQWWLRRPRRSYYYFIPNAQLEPPSND